TETTVRSSHRAPPMCKEGGKAADNPPSARIADTAGHRGSAGRVRRLRTRSPTLMASFPASVIRPTSSSTRGHVALRLWSVEVAPVALRPRRSVSPIEACALLGVVGIVLQPGFGVLLHGAVAAGDGVVVFLLLPFPVAGIVEDGDAGEVTRALAA